MTKAIIVSADWLQKCGQTKYVNVPLVVVREVDYGSRGIMYEVDRDGYIWTVWSVRGVKIVEHETLDMLTNDKAKAEAYAKAAIDNQNASAKWSATSRDENECEAVRIHAQRVAASFAEAARDAMWWHDLHAERRREAERGFGALL